MADKDIGERSPIKDAGWLAFFLIILGVIWFAQGGPEKLAHQAPFVKSPSPTDFSAKKQPAASLEIGEKPAVLELVNESRYKEKVFLRASASKETDPQKEYLEIRISSKIEPVLITGWKLKGKEGLEIAVGNGAYLPYSGQVNPQEPIYLKPNGKAIIVTGRSPLGTSFRLNICTGYFNQFQKFYPSLPQECPEIDEKEVPLTYPDACYDFVRGLPRCRMPLSIPPAAGNDCILFINKKANYSDCVALHKNEPDFYKGEWRVYLGRDKELWGKRDKISLIDGERKIVDEVSY